MKFYSASSSASNVSRKYVLLDGDFLGELYRNHVLLSELKSLFSAEYFLVHPFVEFEFLRDVFLPVERILKRQFISEGLFVPMPLHQEVLVKIQDNAMLLSKIYAHKGFNKIISPSLVDLYLAGQCMLNSGDYSILTCNRKDFPHILFDQELFFEIEQNDHSLKRCSLLTFNRSSFDKCYEELKLMEGKYEQEVNEMLKKTVSIDEGVLS